MQLVHPGVAQPKLGALRSKVGHCSFFGATLWTEVQNRLRATVETARWGAGLEFRGLHLLFCCFDIVLMTLFSAAISRDSIFFLRLPFLNNFQVFFCEISLVCRLKCPWSCFSSHFCFLVIFVFLILVSSVLFMVSEIILHPRFFM